MTDPSDGSRLLGGLQTSLKESRVYRRTRTFVGRVERAGENSSVVRSLDRASKRLGRVARDARLYRWLTAEPEPDVIVIDLRETYTVGPVIAVLDRLVGWVGPRWQASAPKHLFDRGVETLRPVVADSRAVDALEAVLVPPEPADSRGREDAGRDDRE